MWDARNVLDSLLWEAAVDDMGIYPRAVIRDGVETPRSEWQDGWNAAVMDITKKHSKLVSWSKSLTDEQRAQLLELLDSDSEPIHIGYRGEAVTLTAGCSDTFMYACADSEPFEIAELPEVCRLWVAHGYYGVIAWIARKRRVEPVKEYRYDAGYLAAKADLIALPERRDEAQDVSSDSPAALPSKP